MTDKTITRRSVTRGLAWTAPIVAVAVAAPAFAASVTIPPPTVVGSVVGGKCPGGSTDFGKGFVLPVTLSTEVESFVVTSFTYNGTTLTPCVAPADPLPSKLFALSWDHNSSANGSGSGSGSFSGTYFNGTATVPFTGVFNFSYNGTHPIDNKVRQAVCTAAGNCTN